MLSGTRTIAGDRPPRYGEETVLWGTRTIAGDRPPRYGSEAAVLLTCSRSGEPELQSPAPIILLILEIVIILL